MRILSFAKHWPKLEMKTFTTFRMPRKDRDWYAGEEVQVWVKARRPDRELLGIAVITSIETTAGRAITEEEAQVDGFESSWDMFNWLVKEHGGPALMTRSLNKLGLTWSRRAVQVGPGLILPLSPD